MASSLTASGVKSSYLYLGVIIIFLVVVGYFWFLKQPSLRSGLEQNAFYFNFLALKNSIRLANLKFLAGQANPTPTDQWVENEVGLDFNSKGYPIGTDITNSRQEKPESAENCKQIWQFLMGPLQPRVSTNSEPENYLVTLMNNDICVYRSPRINDRQIRYNSNTGKVSLLLVTG
ncbi:hypothetical protein [Aliikangiella coralliicola]|uniref:MSHA biogenesis protein MshF n=1 Tax=Aliikangiella coralliicola TaxID=2592383 RepID=A0A545UGD9_9GAMM|nr:hypothetical protein [Aliikangiella coralliicola]TQV88540.1 hypothetical protein FLL46_08450 [Aliikangiella coralliicola]